MQRWRYSRELGGEGRFQRRATQEGKKGQRDLGLYVGTNQAILYDFGTTSSLLNHRICKSSCRASEIIRLSPDLGCPADGGLEPRHRFFYRSLMQQQQCLLGLREPLQIPCDLCAGVPLCARSVASLDQCRHANCFHHRGQAILSVRERKSFGLQWELRTFLRAVRKNVPWKVP
jgi:hypothetical protein